MHFSLPLVMHYVTQTNSKPYLIMLLQVNIAPNPDLLTSLIFHWIRTLRQPPHFDCIRNLIETQVIFLALTFPLMFFLKPNENYDPTKMFTLGEFKRNI